MMTEKRLDEIEARANLASDGPWKVDPCPDYLVINKYGSHVCETFLLDNDSEFIAAARQDVPDLVAEVRRLRAALNAVRPYLESRADTADGDPPGPNRAMSLLGLVNDALGEQ